MGFLVRTCQLAEKEDREEGGNAQKIRTDGLWSLNLPSATNSLAYEVP